MRTPAGAAQQIQDVVPEEPMKAITLQIAMNHPPWASEEDVLFPWSGYDFGVPGLAVSPTPRKVGDGQLKRKYRSWVIVHLSSGRRIGPEFSSRATAASLGLQLGELLSDWTYSDREILGNPDLVRAGKYIVYGGVRS